MIVYKTGDRLIVEITAKERKKHPDWFGDVSEARGVVQPKKKKGFCLLSFERDVKIFIPIEQIKDRM